MDADQHKSFASQFGITGFPTIKVFTGRKNHPYKGQRTAEAFVDAALKAAKDKAYESLGKRSNDYTSDKVLKDRALKSLNDLIKGYVSRSRVLNSW